MGYLIDIYTYSFALLLVYQGVVALVKPEWQFKLRGIKDTRSSDDVTNFAAIYMLGARDVCVGFFIAAHYYVDNPMAVLSLLGLMSFVKFSDAVVVIAAGDEATRTRAIEHMSLSFGFLNLLFQLRMN
jgi:hypothetical protein